MVQQQRNRLSHTVTPIGFGAFKIGRNEKTKYPTQYDLPSDEDVAKLLDSLIGMGINFIDTAPAYGVSESRLGEHISHRRDDFILSSKVGEVFENGQSIYGYSKDAVLRSVEQSLERLRTDRLDILFIHSNGNDMRILDDTDTVDGLIEVKQQGLVREIGMSGKTVDGMKRSLEWADSIMVEYNANETNMLPVIQLAAARGISVMVKKGLASGHLDADAAVRFVLAQAGVTSLVIGSLNQEHMRRHLETALSVRSR